MKGMKGRNGARGIVKTSYKTSEEKENKRVRRREKQTERWGEKRVIEWMKF